MKKLIILITIFLLTLLSCSGKTENIVITNSDDYIPYTTIIHPIDENKNEFSVDNEAVEIISNLKLEGSCKTLFGNEQSISLNNHIYLHISDGIRILNTETGKTDKLCADPLCSHNNNSCPDYPTVNSMICDNNNIYIKGITDNDDKFSVSGSSDRISFIGKYSPKENRIIILDYWAKENGSVSYCLAEKDGYIYYLRRISDEENSLYRVGISGGKAEKISSKKEFIQQFSLTDDRIIYCTSSRELKSMNYDGSNVIDIAAKYCMTYNSDNISVRVSSVYDKGYDLELSGSDLKIKVNSPVDTFIYDNKIWYTTEKEINYGVFKNENGDSYTLKTYNGDTVYSTDIISGETSEYILDFGYGVTDVYCVNDSYMIVGLGNEKQSFDIWLVDLSNTENHWKIYEN